MPRFNGIPVETAQQPKPRFQGVPVDAAPSPAVQPAAPAAQPFNDPALFMPGSEPSAPAAPAQAPSWLDQVFGSAQRAGQNWYQFGLGASKGITNVAGLPGDVIDILPKVNIGGVEINPASAIGLGSIPDTQDIQRVFGIDRAPQPDSWLQKLMSRIGEELGAAAVPAGGIASKAARMGLPAVREAGGLTRYFLEPAAVNLPEFLGKEAAVATASGTGAGLANLAVDRNSTAGQWADMAGAFGGAGLFGAGSAVGRRLGDILAALSNDPKYASQVVRQNVADTLTQNSDTLSRQIDPANPQPVDTTDYADLLSRVSQAEQTIPGFRASTADRAGDFGLANLENARARGPNAGRYRARQEGNTEAVDTQLGTVAPNEPPGTFFDALNAQRDAQLTNADQQVQQAQNDLQPVLDLLRVPPGSTTATRGNTVRSALEDAQAAAQARTDAAYQAADTTGNMVDPQALSDAIDSATSSLTAAERSLVPEGMLARVRALADGGTDAAGNPVPAPPVDLREATTLLSEIKRLQRAALADPRAERGGRNAARVLDQISEALDTFVRENVSPDQAVAWDAARATKFDEAQRFTRTGDPVAAALARNEGGVPKMRDERVAGSFVVPDSNLGRLFTEADTPDVRQAIKDELLSRFDNSSARTINQFLATFDQQIGRFPGLRQEITDAANGRVNEARALTVQHETQQHLGTRDGVAGRSSIARFLKYDETRADAAMQGVLSAGKPAAAMDELLSFVGDDPAAVEGAKAAFWRVMEKTARSQNGATETANGIEPWLPKKWVSFLNNPAVASVMERLYQDNPEHLAMIREIAQALRGSNLGNKAGAALNPSGSGQMLRNGPITLAEAQAKFIDVQRGRLSPLYAVTYLAGKIADRLVSKQAEKAYQMLLDEALLNPDIAAALLKENNPANRAALARRAKGWLGNEAASLAQVLNGNDQEKQ